MKKFVLFSFVFFVFAGVNAQSTQASVNARTTQDSASAKMNAQTTTDANAKDISSVLWFNESDHDFGKIPYGKPAEFDLQLKNLTTDSLTIENVVAGCGCTTPKWKPGPYAPGETFKMTIGFNGYTEGAFHKIVTVYLKDGLTKVINFHGETFKTPDSGAPANGAVQKLKSGGK